MVSLCGFIIKKDIIQQYKRDALKKMLDPLFIIQNNFPPQIQTASKIIP
jgi:hypothetical protein